MDAELQNELTDVKQSMRSLVISSPTRMDCRALQRDFKTMMGEHIPFRKFGYSSLLAFLKERCSDCFVFSGDPSDPVLVPIVTEKTKHINDLISKQKIAPSAKFKGKRTSVLQEQIHPKPRKILQPKQNKNEMENQFKSRRNGSPKPHRKCTTEGMQKKGKFVPNLERNQPGHVGTSAKPHDTTDKSYDTPARPVAVSNARAGPASFAPRLRAANVLGVPRDGGIFPEGCMEHWEPISGLSPLHLTVGEMYDVNVTEVLDPSHFLFQLRSDKHDLALEQLMDDMTEYYTKGEGCDRIMEADAVQMGQYCATNFQTDGWHRSIIARVNSDTVKVRHIDYGSVDTVPRRELRVLLRRWAALPRQALRGCLANLRPGSGTCWTMEESDSFRDLVNGKPLVAKIQSIDRENEIVQLFLADTNSEVDIYINLLLVQKGFASCVNLDQEISPPTIVPPPPVEAVASFVRTQVSRASSSSDVSESASAIVDRPPRRLKEWSPSTLDADTECVDNMNADDITISSKLCSLRKLANKLSARDTLNSSVNTKHSIHSTEQPTVTNDVLASDDHTPKSSKIDKLKLLFSKQRAVQLNNNK